MTDRVGDDLGRLLPRVIFLWLTLASLTSGAPSPPDLVWSKVIATEDEDDRVTGLAVNREGQIAIVGVTQGGLFLPTPEYHDAFVAVYDGRGELQWGRQFGERLELTTATDVVWTSYGDVAMVGDASYRMTMSAPTGAEVYVRSYRPTGSHRWTYQLGGPQTDNGAALVESPTGIAVAGDTYSSLFGAAAGGNDAFLAELRSGTNGVTSRWGEQVGTSDWDVVNDMAYGAGAYYVAGLTYGAFAGPDNTSTDAMLIKLSSQGEVEWSRQYGSASQPQGARAVETDGQGSVYIAGYTFISQNYATGGLPDAFLTKYDESGTRIWERTLVTPGSDEFYGLDVDDAGNIYVGGVRNMGNRTPVSSDVYVAKYSPTGVRLWEKQFDFGISDRISRIVVDGKGERIWIAGTIYGDGVFGTDQNSDGFLAYLETPLLAGDFDGNGIVNQSDYNLWRQDFGSSNAAADANSDGVVNAADYTVWRDAMQAAGLGTAVPEPTATALLPTFVLAYAGACRRIGSIPAR